VLLADQMGATKGDASDDEGVQEHLKDAVEGSLRLKRLLSSELEGEAGQAKKQKLFTVGEQESKKIDMILARLDLKDDLPLRHVLSGCMLAELDALQTGGWKPDPFQWGKSPADLAQYHLSQMRERETAGGGTLDVLNAFCFKWKLNKDVPTLTLLRKLSHKDLRYVIDNYNGEKPLAEIIAEAETQEPPEGVATGCCPDGEGVKLVGRFHRLELIDALADAVVLGDANLTFALKLAKHRKALGHVGRVIATTFESLEVLRERYKEIDETIRILEDLHAEVYHEVDCTRIAVNPQFKGLEGKIGAVYYNFPHAGAVGGFFDGHPMVNWRHENLMRLFFRALRSFVKPGGIVKVASNMGAVGVRFSYITGGGIENEFDHVETMPFMQWALRRYGRSYGDKRDAYRRPEDGEGYNVQRADKDMVYTFVYRPTGNTLPPQRIRPPPTLAVLEALTDGAFDVAQGEARKNLAKKLHARFLSECSGQHVG